MTGVNDLYLLALYRILLNQSYKLPDKIRHAGSAEAALAAYSGHPGYRESLTEAEQDLAWLEQSGHHLIQLEDDDYPESLREIHDPPPLLFAAGDRHCLSQQKLLVAMVGARKASQYGLNQARKMAAELADRGITIVSGLALGIDAASHEGALETGGITIAVLGTGCDRVYPRRNWRLAERIERTGLVLSEFPTGVAAFPSNFPRRNRIVTGMTLGTVVVEAALKSGSLVSARLAAAEGREVMAVPGLVSNLQSRGCHRLIQEGAMLVETSADVMRELGLNEDERLEIRSPLSPDQEAVLESLSSGPQTVDTLLTQHACPVEELTVTLVSLEVLGLIMVDGGRYQLNGVAGR